ncbi:MAG: hypothetical protein ACLGHL_00955, partial [Actinomycetota bacterium]
MSADRDVTRGGWLWALRVAERTVYVTISALFLTIHVADLDTSTYRTAVGLVAFLVVASVILFRLVLPRMRRDRRGAWLGVVCGA